MNFQASRNASERSHILKGSVFNFPVMRYFNGEKLMKIDKVISVKLYLGTNCLNIQRFFAIRYHRKETFIIKYILKVLYTQVFF